MKRNKWNAALLISAAILLVLSPATRLEAGDDTQQAQHEAKDAQHQTKVQSAEADANATGEQMDESERVKHAAEVLEDAVMGEDAEIPLALLEEARGIVVIPQVVKGAFMIGGQYGKGLASWRGDDGSWSAPAFVGMGGASYGFQVGVQTVDLVLVITDERGLTALLEDELKLGASMSVTAGPVGRHAEAGVNVTLDSGIYSYSRSKGVFAGVSLDGAVVTLDDGANADVYGQGITGEVLLRERGIQPPPLMEPFMTTLREEVPSLES